MIVSGVPQRPVGDGDFADLTSAAVVGMRWVDGWLELEFASDLAPAVVSAIVQRMGSRNANEETLRNQGLQALQNNRDFLAVVTPTQAQVLAQVRALTKQSNGVIRQLLGILDGTD